MSFAEVLVLFENLVKLGISAPVQAALSAAMAKLLGVPQNVLDAALAAAKDAPAPK